MTKRRPFSIVLAVAIVIGIGATMGFTMFGFPGIPNGPAGSYMIKVSKSDDQKVQMQMLTTFTSGGQIITSDTTDFGVSPFTCTQEPADKSQSPGHGVWDRKGQTVVFQVQQLRFDSKGGPIGILRVFGKGKAGPNSTVIGTATIHFLNNEGAIACSTEATFEGVPMSPTPEDKE